MNVFSSIIIAFRENLCNRDKENLENMPLDLVDKLVIAPIFDVSAWVMLTDALAQCEEISLPEANQLECFGAPPELAA